MIETKTETTFETLVLLPMGEKLDKLPSASNTKSMWDWFTAHFIEGIRETIVRGAPSKTVIYGSEAYIIKGTITPAKGSKPEATKITKAVRVPLHSITLGRLVILAKEGKALATIIKDKVAVDTLTLTNIETIQLKKITIQLKDPSKVTPKEKKFLQQRRKDPTPEERTRLNYKNEHFKMLKSMYAGKDLKSHFNLKEPEKKAAGKASPQTASRCFPAVGNLTMTANNSTYLSYPRNSTWNLGHLKAFENEVKKILLTGIATDADIQQWADFCIAELRTALGLLDADNLNLDEAMESDEGEGPPEEVESRRVAEDDRLRAEARRNGLNNVNEDEFGSGEFLAQFASDDDDMHGSEDEGGAPTDLYGDQNEMLRNAFALTPSFPQGSQASPFPLPSPSNLATPAEISLPTPAAGTPSPVGNYSALSFGDTPAQFATHRELGDTNAQFVDKCLSFY